MPSAKENQFLATGGERNRSAPDILRGGESSFDSPTAVAVLANDATAPFQARQLANEKMNTLMKWNPFRELDDLQNRLVSYLGRRSLLSSGENLTIAEWTPLVDVTEDDKEYVVTAELPDVKEEDVKVTVQEGILHITGERKFEKEETGKKYHRIERSYGSFERSFSLPENTKPEALTADYKNGVLKVHLPKSAEAKSKTVEVKIT